MLRHPRAAAHAAAHPARPPGGPKLRKWYGQEGMPRDGGLPPAAEEEQEPAGGGVRDVILVTDGESEMGEQVVLQLILAR